MKLEHNFIVDCARDVGIRYFDIPNCLAEVQSLCEFAELIYAKGQETMRERCAKVCDDLERAKWESVSDIAQNKGRIAFAGPVHCATGIRALPIQKGGRG